MNFITDISLVVICSVQSSKLSKQITSVTTFWTQPSSNCSNSFELKKSKHSVCTLSKNLDLNWTNLITFGHLRV